MFIKKNSKETVEEVAEKSPVVPTLQTTSEKFNGRGLVIVRNEDNNGWRIDLVESGTISGRVIETVYRSTVWADLTDRYKILSHQLLFNNPTQFVA